MYEISCGDCTATYIGETTRSVQVRKKEHERHTNSGRIEESAVAEHVWDSNHRINWNAVKVLDMERGWRARRTKEALHIAIRKPSLNRDVGLELSPFWLQLVKK